MPNAPLDRTSRLRDAAVDLHNFLETNAAAARSGRLSEEKERELLRLAERLRLTSEETDSVQAEQRKPSTSPESIGHIKPSTSLASIGRLPNLSDSIGEFRRSLDRQMGWLRQVRSFSESLSRVGSISESLALSRPTFGQPSYSVPPGLTPAAKADTDRSPRDEHGEAMRAIQEYFFDPAFIDGLGETLRENAPVKPPKETERVGEKPRPRALTISPALSPSDQAPAAPPSKGKLNAETRAMAVATKWAGEHRALTVAGIAREAGCSKSYLYRCERFMALFKSFAQNGSTPPRGWKSRETGEFEAYDAGE